MLIVKCPREFAEQARYVVSILLGEFLGVPSEIRLSDQNQFQLKLGQKGITVCSEFFQSIENKNKNSFTDRVCSWWDSRESGWDITLTNPIVPVLFGEPAVRESENHIHIGLDIFGSAFFMLTRFEEFHSNHRDQHDRFSSQKSMARKNGFLTRPVIDEYVEVLWAAMKKLWPNLARKPREFRTLLSHDVDRPSRFAFVSPRVVARRMLVDIVKRRDFGSLAGPLVWRQSKKKLHSRDPYNTFDWIMDISEQHNVCSSFYFICGRTDPVYDAVYEIEHPAIRDLLQRIHARGHEIGLHPSYNTFRNPETIAREAKRLKTVCQQEGIKQSSWGGRMHYLRWSHPETLLGWQRAGMDYESTLGYADHPGFRCGTCFEYPAFNLKDLQVMKVRIRPLIAMEASVISAKYMNLGHSSAALHLFSELKGACKLVGGNFTLLWHNSEFEDQRKRNLYLDVLNA